MNPQELLEDTARKFGKTVSDLISRKRDAMTVEARQSAMYIIRQETNLTLYETGGSGAV
jgi:chromosomal replication initiation ATPase DnaA